jgi:hypothetical protein
MPNIIQLNVLMKGNIGHFRLQIKLINAASLTELKFNDSNTNRKRGGILDFIQMLVLNKGEL